MNGDTAGRPGPAAGTASGDRSWNVRYDTGGGDGPSPDVPRAVPSGTGASRRRGGPRVLTVADEWFPARGGLSSLNRYLCFALASAGATVDCLVPGYSPDEQADAARGGVHLVAARGVRGMTEREALMRRPPLPGGAEPDLVIGHGRVTGPAARALVEDHFPRAARVHLVHMAPDDIEWDKLDHQDDAGLRAEERSRVELELARDATAVAPVGPRLREWLRRDLPPGADGGRARLIRLDPGFDPVDPAPRPVPEGRPLVMVMGRMEDAVLKGVDLAARAFGHARALHPGVEWELLVRGAPAGQEHAMRGRVLEWIGDRTANVTVRRYSSDTAAIQEDLRRASLMLMPSRVEGYGLVGHEALVAGTPALISERSGLGMLVEDLLRAGDARGIVVPAQRAEELDVSMWGHRIAAVMADRAAAFSRAADARRTLAARHPWAVAVRELLDLL